MWSLSCLADVMTIVASIVTIMSYVKTRKKKVHPCKPPKCINEPLK